MQANEQLMERESELRARLERETQHLIRAQRTARMATFHRYRGSRMAASPAFNSLLGIDTQAKASEQALWESIHPFDRDKIQRAETAFYQSAEAGIDHEYDCRILRDGEIRWIRWIIRKEVDEQGRFVSFIGAIQDITEQRASERRARALALVAERRVKQLTRLSEALRESRHAAEAALRVKADFLAAVSHDIRTPLNGIMGMLHLLSLDTLRVDQHERLGIAQDAANQLHRYIEDVIDMAQTDEGALEYWPQAVDIRVQLEAVIRFWQGGGRQEPTPSLDLDIDPSLGGTLVTDPVRLRQILNVCIERLAERGVPIRLRVERQPEGIDILLSCRGEEQARLVADPRQRALLKRLAATIGAQIRPLNAKARVGIVLSLAAAEASPGVQPEFSAPEETPHPWPEGDTLRVLVVDDIETNRVVLTQLLQVMGYASDVACDGDEAVEKVLHGGEAYAVVLMDLRMPRMSGEEAVACIRAAADPRWKRLPIVAVTAHAGREELAALSAQGFTEAMTKPVDHQRLSAVLRRVLDAGALDDATLDVPDDDALSDETTLAPDLSPSMPIEPDYFRTLFKPLAASRRELLLKVAIDDLDRLIQELEAGHARNSAEDIERAAHSLKGVSGNFGAFSLMAAVEAYRALPTDEAAARLPALRKQVAGVIEHARDLFADLDSK
ncbi:PAS domain-containing hybrid sensor histidine kinase/response regulator [Salinicola endophyticus]|uniref:histidine kinase n=1 Tax=Salinicola endophyticus TaxID=1949083 RepID=A0ABY8FFW6_9GAMM|nr:PAS domain-containing hybrid sensor histidine kinase/response regulator [Salinicola endophyticus]WFF41698.1 PAS domain-containing hybrid sensor histidine kinase/response regulator [Salinicola endophyticus]